MGVLAKLREHLLQDDTMTESDCNTKVKAPSEKQPLMIHRLSEEEESELNCCSAGEFAQDVIRQWRPGPLSDSFPMG